MPQLIDETGKRHTRLFVIGRAGSAGNRDATWHCECDCGRRSIVRGYDLRRGATRSCGCLNNALLTAYNIKRKLGPRQAAFRRTLCDMKRNARRRGRAWELSEKQAASLMASVCHYCGTAPGNVAKSRSKNGDFSYSGIDRRDNSRGYIPGNVVSCCWDCNKAKNKMSEEQFLLWVDRVFTFRFGKEGKEKNEPHRADGR